MKELSDYLFDLGVKYEVDADRVLIINHINSYFALNRRNVICYWDEDLEEFCFAQYDDGNKLISDGKTIRDFSFSVVRRLLWHIRILFKTEAARLTDLKSARKILYTVVAAQIINIDNKTVYTVYYVDNTPFSIPITLDRLPEHYRRSLFIGKLIPLYVRELTFTNKDSVEVKANPFSRRIPELLIEGGMREEGYSIGYIKCVKRILGKYSKIVTDRFIDKLVIKSVSRTLKERITIKHLSEDEVEKLLERKTLSLSEIRIKNRRRDNAKRR
jgi:hypothetical protein